MTNTKMSKADLKEILILATELRNLYVDHNDLDIFLNLNYNNISHWSCEDVEKFAIEYDNNFADLWETVKELGLHYPGEENDC